MPLDPTRPIIYLITNGTTCTSTSPNSPEFSDIIRLVEVAVSSEIPLVQLREKNLSIRVLHELACQAMALTRKTKTRLLVNDRFDVALAAGADGVHLTSQSIPTDIVRKACGEEFLIGVSTHAMSEARLAHQHGADFVLFGPVFDTESKRTFGQPQGTDKLREVANALKPFPVVAIGGISLDNVNDCFAAGASGVAAIRLLADEKRLIQTVEDIRLSYTSRRRDN